MDPRWVIEAADAAYAPDEIEDSNRSVDEVLGGAMSRFNK